MKRVWSWNGCAGIIRGAAWLMLLALSLGQLAVAQENGSDDDADKTFSVEPEVDNWQQILPSNPLIRKIVLLPTSKFYCVNDAAVKVRVLCDKQSILTDANSRSSRANVTEPFSVQNLFFDESDAPSAAPYGAEYEDLYDLGSVDLPVTLHQPSVGVGDTKLWAKWLDPGGNPVEGPMNTITQIKVDLDGRESGTNGLQDVDDAAEVNPGVLLSNGSTELVVQPILQGSGLAAGTLKLTWLPIYETNKKLEVNGDSDGSYEINCASTALPLTLPLKTLRKQADGTWAAGAWDFDDQITVTMTHSGAPQCVDSVKLNVLKVEINRVLSDQLPNRECNLLPGQNPMYMGTRVDDRGYLQVEASVLPQQINNVGLVGIRHGTTILDSGPIQLPKTPLDFAPTGSRQQYQVVGGVDQNGDGQLQNTEICTTFSPNVLTLTQSDYNYSHGVLNTYATTTWGTGSQLLEAFIDDTVPPNVVNTQTTITSGELTHPLGANWDYSCSATTRRYTYIEGTETSDDVEEDDHTITALKTSLNQHKTEVQNYFTQNPSVTEHTFGPWNWQVPNLQFDGLSLQFAFGHVTIFGTVLVTVRQSDLEVTNIVYGGSFDDIYDFAYNGAYPSVHGATVQAGFPTLGTGGRVFRDRVEFSRVTTDFDYDFN